MTNEEFPFTTPAGSDARMFIQWKGTQVCMDFYCQCGAHVHGDGGFAYNVECGACGAFYEMGTQVIAKRVNQPDGACLYLPHEEWDDTPPEMITLPNGEKGIVLNSGLQSEGTRTIVFTAAPFPEAN
jgi:hypothetical protein